MSRRKQSPLLLAVTRFFEQRPFLHRRRLLVAVSGGPDSVALLYALHALAGRFELSLCAAHFNHGLRGEEAARDEAFVRGLCADLGLALEVGSAQRVRSGANLEERAREARYEFLGRTARDAHSDYIALAHHADDQAETVMLRLLRGTGVAGLGAMAEVGPAKLIRPLLGLRRSQVLQYLEGLGAGFVEDSTNAACYADRNRLRHHLLPLLERDFAPGLAWRLSEMAGEMRDVQTLLEGLGADFLAANVAPDGSLLLEDFVRLPAALARVVLRCLLRSKTGGLRRFERCHIESLRHLCACDSPNAELDLPGGWRASRQYGKLKVARSGNQPVRVTFDLPLLVSGGVQSPAGAMSFECTLMDRAVASMPTSRHEAVFDAHALAEGLRVRNVRPGDRIAPLGMKGSRKVKDVFIEYRIPRGQRPLLPVVVMGEQVVWLPGLVRSNTALVNDRTVQVLRVRELPDIAPNLTPVLASP